MYRKVETMDYFANKQATLQNQLTGGIQEKRNSGKSMVSMSLSGNERAIISTMWMAKINECASQWRNV